MLAEVIAQARDGVAPFLSDRRFDAVYRGAVRQRLEQLIADMDAVLALLDQTGRRARRRRAVHAAPFDEPPF